MRDSFFDRWSEAATGTLSGIVDLRLHLAAARLLRLLGKANFNPDQPRAPAGQPDGGQWTASPGTADGESAESPRLVQVERGRRYDIDLYEEEGVGHTIAVHVGKSPDQLWRRVADSHAGSLFASMGIYRAGSFPSVEAARKLVNSTLAQNSEIVEQVASGKMKENVFVTATFFSKTGIEAFMPEGGRTAFFR